MSPGMEPGRGSERPARLERTMEVRTTRFGTIEIAEDRVITFPKGLLGFSQFTRYCLLEPGVDSAFFAHQAGDIRLPIFARVTSHDTLHRCIGFERRAVNADGLPTQQAMLVGQSQHELKHFLAHFEWQTLTGVRECRVIGRSVGRAVAEELSERTAVVTTPSDAALAVDAFEEADEQHAKVDARGDRRLATFLFGFVILLAAAFEPSVELGRGE